MNRKAILGALLASSSVFAAPGWDANPQPTPSANAPQTENTAREISSTTGLAQNMAGGGSPAQALLNGASGWATGAAQSIGQKYLPTFELGFSLSEHNKPVFGVLGVIPLFETKDLSNTVFSQVSSYRADGRTTVNIGIGDRYLVANERLLLGVNAFYDHEFPYGHARTSVGAELRSSALEFNTNFYQAQSGWKTGRDGIAEKAMGGYDAEVSVALPYMPLVKAYARHFQWNAIDGAADISGNTISLKANPVEGISVEAGRTYYSGNAQPNVNSITVQFDLIKLFNPSARTKPFFAREAYAFESMREHRYDKVRRENIIQKQTGRGFIVTASGR